MGKGRGIDLGLVVNFFLKHWIFFFLILKSIFLLLFSNPILPSFTSINMILVGEHCV